MTRTEIITELLSIVTHTVGVDLKAYELSLKVSDMLDSLDKVLLVMKVETHFKVTILDKQIDSLQTFNDLVDFICNAKAIVA